MRDAINEALTCAFCGGPAEGNYSIHRDGFDVGPEVELCDEHGGHEKPTCEEIWDRIAQPAEAPATSDTIDDRAWYWRKGEDDQRPHGDYPSREAALADVRGHFFAEEMPARVLVGRCTQVFDLAAPSADDVAERIRDILHFDIGVETDVSIVDEDIATAELREWCLKHVDVDAMWITSEADEEWADVPAEEGDDA